MTLALDIAERSILLFGAILFLAQLICYEAGHWFGRRRPTGAGENESVGVLVGAMLGLLAFVLALTLSFASTRFAERQSGSLAEANAIGTAWLRARAIGGQEGEAIASLLRQYAVLRTEFVESDRGAGSLALLNQRTGAVQSEIWAHLTTIVRKRPDPVANSLMVSLNEVFDASTTERFSFSLRLPTQIFWLLIALTLLSMISLGYQFGLKSKAPRPLVIALMLVWTLVLLVILDLSSPRIGQIRTTTAAYVWTLQGLGERGQ